MLSRPDLTLLQYWALSYHTLDTRREEFQKYDSQLRQLSLFTNPKLYKSFYKDKAEEDVSEEFTPEDFGFVEQMVAKMKTSKSFTVNDEDWGEWT